MYNRLTYVTMKKSGHEFEKSKEGLEGGRRGKDVIML